MFWSLVIAFIVTPWASHPHPALGQKIFQPHRRRGARRRSGQPHLHSEHAEDFFTRLYRRVMGPLIAQRELALAFPRRHRRACCSARWRLVGIGWVKVKMLPFDNKSEFQIILNMPEGSALERTAAGRARNRRRRPHRTGGDRLPDLRGRGVALQLQRPGAPLLHAPRRERRRHPGQPRRQRRAQGAEPRHRQARPPARGGDRREVTARASPWPKCRPARRCCKRSSPKSTARTKRAATRSRARCIDIFKSTPGVVDVDWYIEADQPKARFVIDKEKAALHGISAETISQTLRIAVGGESVDLLHRAAREGGREHRAANCRAPAAPRRRNCSPCACAPATPMRCPNPARPPARRRWSRCANW